MNDLTLCGKLIPVRNNVNSNSNYLYRTVLFNENKQTIECLFTATDIKKFNIVEDISLPVGFYANHSLDNKEGILLKLHIWKIKNEQLPEISNNRKKFVGKNTSKLVADLTIDGEWVEVTVFVRRNLLDASNARVNALKNK